MTRGKYFRRKEHKNNNEIDKIKLLSYKVMEGDMHKQLFEYQYQNQIEYIIVIEV